MSVAGYKRKFGESPALSVLSANADIAGAKVGVSL
jgi:hypothetical protein